MANGNEQDSNRPSPANKSGSAAGVSVTELAPEDVGRVAVPVTDPTPGFGERARAATAGTASGARQLLPFLGGTAGGILGAPLGPGGAAGGTALGAGIGENLKRLMKQQFDTPTAEELPQDLRPAFYVGEVIGAGVTGGAAPFAGIGRRSGNRLLDRVFESLESNPGRIAAMEASSIGAQATAEGMSESLAPGETGTRIGTGIVAGTAFPSPASKFGLDAAMNSVKRISARFSRDAQEDILATQLQDMVTRAGENPQKLARLARESELPELNRSTAQLTGSPILQEFENEMVRRSGEFGREVRQTAEQNLQAMRSMLGGLIEVGTPEAMQEAAKLRERYVKTLLEGQVSAAERRVTKAADDLQPDTPEGTSELSRRANEIMQNSLERARQAERQLWSKVDQDAKVTPNASVSEAERIRLEEVSRTEGLPGRIQRFTNMAAEEENVPLREVMLFRRDALEEARRLASEGQHSQARLYGHMAEAALEDMDKAGAANSEALRTAREYSRQLHDTFTRSFAGEATGTTRKGGPRVPPELMLRRATGSGEEITALRMNDLRNAVEMGSPEAAEELIQIQDNFFRRAATDMVDEETGRISPKSLQRFRNRNKEILKQFPELDEQLGNAQRANEFFDETVRSAERGTRRIDQKAAFARVANAENPTTEVNRILSSDQPERELTRLAKTARTNGGEDAVAGLRSSILDIAFQRAGGGNDQNRFSFTNYRKALMEPRRPGQKPLLRMMRDNDIIDKDTTKNLKRILKEADKVESTLRNSSNIEGFLENNSALSDLAVRLAGVHAASATGATNAGPGGLVVAGQASSFAQHAFNKVPLQRVQDVAIEAARNPKFMATLLEKPSSAKEKLKLTQRVNMHLWSAGIREPGATTEGFSSPIENMMQEEQQPGLGIESEVGVQPMQGE